MKIELLISLLLMMMISSKYSVADEGHEKQYEDVRTILSQFCLDCHNNELKEGELDLQRFTSTELVRADLKPWQAMITQLESREMPPKDQPKPTEAQRKLLIDWAKETLRQAALERAGDPGFVPLHRLSNTEYNNTIRDLTGVNLQPANTFPADGAAGEGFTNAAEALSMSPAMMSKYIQAAKEVSQHVVLLPDGFRFSDSATRRDWSDESLTELRKFYKRFTDEGSLPLKPYLVALLEHREDLLAERTTISQVARNRNLSPKYLHVLWEALNSDRPAFPMSRVCELWADNNVDAVVAEVSTSFDRLWEYPRIGSYVNTHRQKPKDPAIQESQTITIKLDVQPGQSDVSLNLQSLKLGSGSTTVRFSNPRFQQGDGTVSKLRDYQSFGSQYEVDFTQLFAKTTGYLNAAVEAANDPTLTNDELAKKHNIHSEWLGNWISVLNVSPVQKNAQLKEPGRTVSPIEMQLLNELSPNSEHESINGWRPQGSELPIVISNASDKTEHIPGRISPYSVAVHPMPTEFVATVWRSPMAGSVQLSGKVAHAHPACGNGVRWWMELQTGQRSAILQEGVIDLGKNTEIDSQEIDVKQGDRILLAVAARDASHVCDLTEVDFIISEIAESQPRVWDLCKDVATNITTGNPHADQSGNAEVWSFVRGNSNKRQPATSAELDNTSLLAQWRSAASAPDQQQQAANYAQHLQVLLTGDQPPESDTVNRKLYDHLISLNGPLLSGIDPRKLTSFIHQHNEPPASNKSKYGVPIEKFSGDDLILSTDEIVSVRLPIALFLSHQFVVDCQLEDRDDHSAVQFQIATTGSTDKLLWDSKSPVVMSTTVGAREDFLAGLAECRRVFPPNVCYPHVIPLDEVVCLKTFHREDQPLIDLFLNEEETTELERLWQEHRFITKFPIVENEYLPLFIGFVTQDQPKELVEFFEGKRPEFQQRADVFNKNFDAAAVPQLKQLEEFAAQAYRRPLRETEHRGLHELYTTLRDKGIEHEEALRSLIARTLMSPSFLLHIRHGQAKPDTRAGGIALNNWELASRLSYFLWSSMPDAELRQLAADGTIQQPEVLEAQIHRMLHDDRSRSLAIEFGTQWIHVREFDSFNEKNETLFPSFDQELRAAMYEEAIQFFQQLFRENAPVDDLLNADYTFVNERLATHYGIPNVQGQQFRRIDRVKQFGRGGLLGFAAVQSKQAGSSRTSPILRGNWVVETLFGEKLPLPPPNVPQLPEQIDPTDQLTMRQINERHVSDEACAVCHRRIDPFGYALENYDPIGRLRLRDANNLPINALAKVRDGSEFVGIDGLRDYIRTQKQQVITNLFCRRLLGYALGRTTTISDHILIDELTKQLGSGGVADAVILIVNSPQFQNLSHPEEEGSK